MMAKLEALNPSDEAVILNAQGFVTECVGENIFSVNTMRGHFMLTRRRRTRHPGRHNE